MNKLLLTPILALAACTTFGTGSTGAVQQIGKDSYTVRTLSQKSVSEAKQRALAAANDSCAKAKRNVMLVNEYTGTEEGTAEKFYDLTFMCLTPGDQDFQRVKKETLVPAATTPVQNQ
jgi:hypothetical protein